MINNVVQLTEKFISIPTVTSLTNMPIIELVQEMLEAANWERLERICRREIFLEKSSPESVEIRAQKSGQSLISFEKRQAETTTTATP